MSPAGRFLMPLVSLVQELSFARSLLAVQEIVRRAARTLTGADGATFVLKEGTDCYYVAEDAIAPLWQGMRFPMQSCISGWAMHHRQAAVVPDIYADPRIPVAAYRPTFVKSLVVVPIRSVDPIGAVGNYWATPHEPTQSEVQTLQPLADATALAMENVRVYAQLEQRVQERTRELEAAREAAHEAREIAERAHRAKSRFLAAASHDLRQPLQSLALLTGTLRRIVTDPDALEAVCQQEAAVATASQLVNAILDITRLDSGAIQPEVKDFAIAELFDELRRDFAVVAGNKGLDFEVNSSSGMVRSDPTFVAQILRNLVSNAIKYTRAGFVSLRCLQQAGSALIEVRDTGIGIPSEHLPHIFDEFYQVGGSASAKRDGYGLGLSIVTRLVNLLGLQLSVRSEPGSGTVFSLQLPASSAALLGPVKQECSRRRPRQRASERGRVLLVEDDHSVRDATRLLLVAEGYQVLTAASAGEALMQAERLTAADLVISDYHLGSTETGLDVIAGLRGRLGTQVKAILLSGDTSPAITGLVLDDILRLARKPVKAEELLQLMAELVGAQSGESGQAHRERLDLGARRDGARHQLGKGHGPGTGAALGSDRGQE